MASLAMHHEITRDCVIPKQSPHLSKLTPLRHLTIPNLTGKLPNHRPSTAVNAAVKYDGLDSQQTNKIDYNELKFNDRTSIESPRVSETVDEWMTKSVTEIVKNIAQTPLLIQIYSNGEVKTEKSTAWNHRSMTSSSSIEGVILVEEITDEVAEDVGGRVRAFGVLVQGRGRGRGECKSTCYLLKTSSVNGGGLGFGCTHFCLMKVKSFHQSVFSQFRDCWLV